MESLLEKLCEKIDKLVEGNDKNILSKKESIHSVHIPIIYVQLNEN